MNIESIIDFVLEPVLFPYEPSHFDKMRAIWLVHHEKTKEKFPKNWPKGHHH